MKQIKTDTHTIEFKKDGGFWIKQGAYGKTDLLNIIRALMADGFTEFKVTTIKKQN